MRRTQRVFVLGQSWLYVKLYMNCKTADKMLVEVIASLVKMLIKQNLIDNWFFVRYFDPDFHLRIRFHLSDVIQIGRIVAIINKKIEIYLRSHLIWKVQYDTYDRELERYDDNLIEETEVFFGINSDCTLELVKKITSFHDENYRWIIALKIVDSIMSMFSFNLLHKISFLEQYSNTFKMEFGFNMHNAKIFSIKYRKYKNIVKFVLNDELKDDKFLLLNNIINKHNKSYQLTIRKIQNKTIDSKNITIDILVSNYIHMSLNRLFKLHNRKYELVLYDFIYRYYKSVLAQKQ